jgi:hypothetical protein
LHSRGYHLPAIAVLEPPLTAGTASGTYSASPGSPSHSSDRGLRIDAPVDHFGRKFSGAEPAASTRWVFLLLLSVPAICWLSLSGRWFRGATDSVGRENRAAHRRVGGADLIGSCAMVSPWTGRNIQSESTMMRNMKPSKPGEGCGKGATSSPGFSASVSGEAGNRVTVRTTRTPILENKPRARSNVQPL